VFTKQKQKEKQIIFTSQRWDGLCSTHAGAPFMWPISVSGVWFSLGFFVFFWLLLFLWMEGVTDCNFLF
jgi:hypothetical protein